MTMRAGEMANQNALVDLITMADRRDDEQCHGIGKVIPGPGKIIVLLFNNNLCVFQNDGPLSSFYLCATICNVLQEPSLVNNGSLRILGGTYAEYRDNLVPTKNREAAKLSLKNILNLAVRIGSLAGDPMSDAPILCHAVDEDGLDATGCTPPSNGTVHIFLDGRSSESEDFISQKPPYFSINWELTWLSSLLGSDGRVSSVKTSKNIIIPVVQKMGHYYIIPGLSGSKVLRVSDPIGTFFSTAGHELLALYLSDMYGFAIDDGNVSSLTFDGKGGGDPNCSRTFITFNRDLGGHPVDLLCVPMALHRGLNHDWDNLR